MKVTYFTESLYPHVDGVSRTLDRLFRTLTARGVDFQIVSPFIPGPDVGWGDRVLHVPFIRFPLYPDYRLSLPRLGSIREHLLDAPPDLVHVVSPTPMAYRAQGLARSMNVPVVASFHTHFVSYLRYYGVPRLERFGWRILRGFYDRCDRVYAPTRSIMTELDAHGVERVELWSRGIDKQQFSPDRRDPELNFELGGGRPVLLLVSRLVKEKDLADLVEVARILRAREVAFELVLVGDGPMKAELEGALPDARFAGHLVGDELARWYASADVFVFPSTTETLGNVVLEALASGLPCVVVDKGGPQDLIDQGVNGFIARSNDAESIATAVQRLLEDPQLRQGMSTAARRAAVARDWEEINGGLLRSYQRVIDEGSRARTAVRD